MERSGGSDLKAKKSKQAVRQKKSDAASQKTSEISIKKTAQTGFYNQDSDDDTLGLEEMLKNDFSLIVSVTPKPEDAFCTKSSEYQLASHWYKKILGMNSYTLDELRLRQAYMSRLSVCLHKKRLSGVFTEVPGLKLGWVDFTEKADNYICCSGAMANSAAWQNVSSMMQQQQQLVRSAGNCCGQGTKSGQCCSRSLGGTNSRKPPQKPAHKVTCKLKPKLVPRHMGKSKDSVASQPDSADELAVPSSSGHREHWPIDEEARTDMKYLLEAIKNELQSQGNSEPDDYLELELTRYREFYALHRQTKADRKAITAAKDPQKERIFMLLNMQKDLVKLLSE
ncbi:PREDICTED: uncharacterized protein LOC108612951 [Drosophila arizonae]|uniref:Uncharacterized protein LOC108612951 n=1 Tax=Drosophila arizonae TaxID=7263 RepID=A0ABM1P2X6_DROAR|nr:PREDICTED: uncharacterized protein LOC108612951 [Drosophila arizonae]XP_017861563.1 PREDICTED: uncharacterized protein LOC108612951 [Drosophila arizonae]